MVWKGGAGEEEETDGGQVEGVEVLEELHEVESVEEEEED